MPAQRLVAVAQACGPSIVQLATSVMSPIAELSFTAVSESGPLTDDWQALGDSAVVSVAVPTGEPLKCGRLYIFLPMGAQPTCPVRGFLNAPFHTDVSRRTMAEAHIGTTCCSTPRPRPARGRRCRWTKAASRCPRVPWST